MIRKRIKQILKKEIVDNETVIVPDLSVNYNFKILLDNTVNDFGVFDSYTLDSDYDYIVVDSSNVESFKEYLNGSGSLEDYGLETKHKEFVETLVSSSGSNITITGECKSRLNELKNYKITNVFSEKYMSGGNTNKDGVDYSNSVENSLIIYYIGGINYVDKIINSVTYSSFSFINNSTNTHIYKPIYKDFTKENIISKPKIKNDVSVVRQEISGFNNNYLFDDIMGVNDIETFASGKFFNILNNN